MPEQQVHKNTPQQHKIMRQVLEISGCRQEDSQRNQSALRKVYYQRLVPLIETICSELVSCNRIHRIDRLEIEIDALDNVPIEALESVVADKFNAAFKRELAIAIDEVPGNQSGLESELELFECFIRTGSVPWWADLSDSQLLEKNIQHLVQTSPQALRSAIQAVQGKEAVFRRLARAYPDRLLDKLITILVPSLAATCPNLCTAWLGILEKLNQPGSHSARTIRNLYLEEILRAACAGGTSTNDVRRFFHAVFMRVAHSLRIEYRVLLADLQRTLNEATTSLPLWVKDITQRLQQELDEATSLHDSIEHKIHEPSHKARHDHAVEHDLAIEVQNNDTANVAIQHDLESDRKKLPTSKTQSGKSTPDESISGKSKSSEFVFGESAKAQFMKILTQLEHDPLFDARYFTHLHKIMARLPAYLNAQALSALETLEHASVQHDDKAIQEALAALIQTALEQNSTESGEHSLEAHKPGTLKTGVHKPEPQMPETQSSVANPLDVDKPCPGADARDKLVVRHSDFSDSDELYVSNAGLVILWPFLENFFGRLELMSDKAFNNAAAIQRAVGLLQYLASADDAPPEILLPLNKMICGMAIDEVFDFGPSITVKEQQECDDLLAAVIQQAPILHDMSIAGFRGSFLLRAGQLSVRDDHWLLRVERETHDIVLDRFPWGVQIIKLPWMKAMMQVEW